MATDDFAMEITERLIMVPGPRRSWYAACPPCDRHDHAWTSPDESETRGDAVKAYSQHLRDFHGPRPKDGSA
jgi:hypothetical protein